MVTGIGGVFFKAKDAVALRKWYDEYLGVGFGDNSYIAFKWTNPHHDTEPGSTSFTFFKQDSKYFDPSTSQFMINFRVKDLDSMIVKLKAAGVWVAENTESVEYGKFAWCMDPEGNKIELWEPVD
jgi:predicted enzyme related to lactoylglutathione lyase